MKRFYYCLVLFCIFAGQALAQKLTAEGPDYVSVDNNFRIEYSVNAPSMEKFHLGDYPQDAFVLVFGPAVSSGSYYSNVNGQSSQSYTTTYTYTFVAKKAGTFTIKGATATVDGKQLKSNDLTIVVSDNEHHGQAVPTSETFMQVSASKKTVYEQEPFVLTFKLYTTTNLANLSGDLQELTDFSVNQLGDPNRRVSIMRETHNGKLYTTLKWREYLLFPQKTGKLTIPEVPFEVTSIQRQQNVDPFEAFMNGGSGEIYNKGTIKSQALDIVVQPLPDKPAGFSGGVGRFTIESSLDNKTPKTNDVVTLKIKISGTGNLNLVRQPEVTFPADFDTYEPQMTDNSELTVRGYEGSVEYEYTAVPRNPGEYDIAPVKFIYFDTEEKAYKTLETEGYHLSVSKGNSDSGPQNVAGQVDDNDIHPIKQGNALLLQHSNPFFGSQKYLIMLGVLLLVFISLFIIFRQRAIDNADIVKNRGKQANKVATKRLKQAARLMKANKPGEFYDESLRALWGYVGDKLNMPVEQLSRENITERLQERNVSPETITRFVEAIDECEFERYAPGDPKGNMGKVYEKAMTAIEQIENNMKRKVKKQVKAPIILLLMMLSLSAQAVTKQEADASYQNGEYQKAIEQYEQLLKEGVSADVYYNLGNAYYRTEQLKMAILNYERALKLSPSDADIRHNLQLAQSKTIDKIAPQSEMFFVTWYHSLVNLVATDTWAYIALVSLALAVILALLYLFAEKIGLRKLGFFGGIFMLVLFLLGNLFAWQQNYNREHRKDAIVMTKAASIKHTPASNGKDAFVLHEGSKVTITDDTMSDWKEISVSDGRKGWIKTGDIELI